MGKIRLFAFFPRVKGEHTYCEKLAGNQRRPQEIAWHVNPTAKPQLVTLKLFNTGFVQIRQDTMCLQVLVG